MPVPLQSGWADSAEGGGLEVLLLLQVGRACMGHLRRGVLSGVLPPIGVPIRVSGVVSRVLYMGHNQPLEALEDCLSAGLRVSQACRC